MIGHPLDRCSDPQILSSDVGVVRAYAYAHAAKLGRFPMVLKVLMTNDHGLCSLYGTVYSCCCKPGVQLQYHGTYLW